MESVGKGGLKDVNEGLNMPKLLKNDIFDETT